MALYSGYADNRVRVEGMVSYGLTNNDTERNINIGTIRERIDGDIDGDVFAARLESGYKFYADHDVEIEPWGSMEYSNTAQDAFTETGSANNLNLSMDAQNTDSLKAQAGVRVGKAFSRENGDVIIPQIRASYERELLDDNAAIGASLGGVRTVVQGVDLPEDTFKFGVGVTNLFNQENGSAADAIYGHYETELTKDSIGHKVSIGYKMTFDSLF